MESSSTEGGSEQGFIEIKAAAERLDPSTVFHLTKEIIGFVLYMHHQIPAVLQHLEIEFDTLKEESETLELTPSGTELNATSRRKHISKVRELKQEIKRLEKLMSSISCLLSAFQSLLTEVHEIQGVVLVLGSSLIRPQLVYEIRLSLGRGVSTSANDWSKSKAADALSRKAIRTLISNGAGSNSYSGPVKLFLLVKSHATSNLSSHFLPKRDFRYSKRVVPLRLHIKCRTQDKEEYQSASQSDSSSTDLIWFQCRHTIKGLASKASLAEE